MYCWKILILWLCFFFVVVILFLFGFFVRVFCCHCRSFGVGVFFWGGGVFLDHPSAHGVPGPGVRSEAQLWPPPQLWQCPVLQPTVPGRRRRDTADPVCHSRNSQIFIVLYEAALQRYCTRSTNCEWLKKDFQLFLYSFTRWMKASFFVFTSICDH